MARARGPGLQVTTALLVGLGEVGGRAARQLVETEGIEVLLVADRDRRRAQRLASSLGSRAEVVRFGPGDSLPPGIGVVACALDAGDDRDVVREAVATGVPCASVDDDHEAIAALLALSGSAAAAGVTVAAGCGLAPGQAAVLARHAADQLDVVDEIRLARSGWAGPASIATVRRERHGAGGEWAGGAWRTVRQRGEELVWFPDPIGGRDCVLVAGGGALLVDAFPTAERVSVHLGEPEARRPFRRRFGDDGEWGAARVEVWGRRGSEQDLVVYGVVERTAVAAGTVLALTAGLLAGCGGARIARPGVHGLAAIVDPVSFLAELSRRGVRTAVFEGAPVA